MIKRDVIEKVIQIGRSPYPSPARRELLKAVKPYDEINRQHWSTWDEITAQMPTDDLIALIKGLTIAENHNNWIGGSVSSVIWTFRELQRRDGKLAMELAEWILPRSYNPYVPFGSHNWGAESLEEYFEKFRDRERKRARGYMEQIRSEREAEEQRKIRGEQRQRSARDRNTDVRKKLVEEIKGLPVKEQLRQIAEDSRYSVNFYPTFCAGRATDAILRNLDKGIRLKLLKKMKGKFRGPWNKFKMRLLCSFRDKDGRFDMSTPWDRKSWYHL